MPRMPDVQNVKDTVQWWDVLLIGRIDSVGRIDFRANHGGGGDSAAPRTPTPPPPPPPQGASGGQLVVKGMSPRSQRAPKAPNGVM